MSCLCLYVYMCICQWVCVYVDMSYVLLYVCVPEYDNFDNIEQSVLELRRAHHGAGRARVRPDLLCFLTSGGYLFKFDVLQFSLN